MPVRDPSGVGEARRAARSLAHRLGFSEPDAGRVAIVASELAANVERHGGGGTLLLSGDGDGESLQVVALDAGRGIARLSESLRDGHSTGGTPGTGLGAVSRLADEWDVWSAAGLGTAVVARVRRGAPPRHAVADGLGHGPDAALAAETAVRSAFGSGGAPWADPADLVTASWNALRATRGAAVAVALVDGDEGVVRFAGVGNVVAVILGANGRRNLVSMNGTAGQGPARVRAFEYPWRAGDTLVAHTDGLGSRWSEAEYGGVAGQDPALLAALLWRDHVRARDDATVVVLREAAGAAPAAEGAPARTSPAAPDRGGGPS